VSVVGADAIDAFEAPGPGFWQLDRSHFQGGTTPIMRWLVPEAVQSAYQKQWPILGVPAETLSFRFVNGFTYTRMRPLIRPDRPSAKPPPAFLLKVGSRLHPEFRRRTRAARRNLEHSPAPTVIAEWHAETRPRLVAQNLEFGAVDLPTLDDAGLADHIEALLTHIRWTFEEHFRLHGYDLGPIGQLLVAGNRWGIPGGDLLGALVGASPSTSAPIEALRRIRDRLAAEGSTPTSLDEVAATSPDIAAELDTYLRHRGPVLFAGYDLDSPTLGEMPDVVLATILSGADERIHDPDRLAATVADLRGRVPDGGRDRFDDLLARAREAMDLRDDNGPITAEWPAGLLRLAMLEAGRRLATSGRLHKAEHVFELGRDELPSIVATGTGPSADDLAARAAERDHQKTLDPPQTLGDPEATPPLDALPGPLAETVTIILACLTQLGMVDEGAEKHPLRGSGIGSVAFEGVARVAENADEAFDRLQPGEVLVTRTTTPAYNMVLTLVGGLVTAEGGPMSHAAVLSRELGIPAVVGAAGAMEAIADGDRVEVDPVEGVVRVLP
jgi:pyruvate,water dikinase